MAELGTAVCWYGGPIRAGCRGARMRPKRVKGVAIQVVVVVVVMVVVVVVAFG